MNGFEQRGSEALWAQISTGWKAKTSLYGTRQVSEDVADEVGGDNDVEAARVSYQHGRQRVGMGALHFHFGILARHRCHCVTVRISLTGHEVEDFTLAITSHCGMGIAGVPRPAAMSGAGARFAAS